jgi:hypothetical protein
MTENRLMAIISGIVRDAVAQGELALARHKTAEEAAFALLALVVGARALMHSDIPLENLGIREPRGCFLRSVDDLLDGMGWRPLASEWDYKETRRRIHAIKLPA